MVDPAEVRTTQAAVAALRDLVLDVARSTHLGVGVPEDELAWWARLVECEVEESTTVLQAARELGRVLA